MVFVKENQAKKMLRNTTSSDWFSSRTPALPPYTLGKRCKSVRLKEWLKWWQY